MTGTPNRLATALADRYRIERELGQGGMATVYLAEDLKHDRKVAIKVLRPELAAVIGAERFLAEIKTTANLQHPHILPLHDSGEADGFLFYVMPYVEGETVRDRISREKQLPVAEAVRIACEVAAALDYAHRHKVIHRDIKPENILLHDGSALVADFGIALAVSSAGSRMTETGMSLGTPHYMSPEQAMGEREITARSDVYALGCVLYEMLTGDPPFTGSTAQAIVARVVTEHPRPLTSQRHTIPRQVEAGVLTALEKLPADRFASAADFAAALTSTSYARTPTTAALPAVAGRGVESWKWKWRFIAAVGVALFAATLAGWGWARARGLANQPSLWQYIALGDTVHVTTTFPALALSPDGSLLAVKDDTPNGLLWLKRSAALEPVPIPGTERANFPVFSPDGQWVAYLADQQLRKVRPLGGGVVTLVDSAAVNGGGVTWLDDGTLIYVDLTLNKLMRVGNSGGKGTVALDNSEMPGLSPSLPTALPDSRGVLFLSCGPRCVTASLRVLDLKTGKQKILLDDATQGWYLPTGHLLYTRRDGTVLAAPFDLDRLELTGPGTQVLERVQIMGGGAQLAFSRAGSLVYQVSEGSSNDNLVVRVAHDGVAIPIDTSWSGAFSSLVVSPDGRRLAVGVGAGTGGLNIWIKRLDRGPLTRLSFGGGDRRPVWSPDGRSVAFIRDTNNTSVVAARYADGSRPDTVLVHLDRQLQEVDWSRDGRWLVVRTDNSVAGAGDILGVPTSGDTTPVPLVATRFTEKNPAVSPDVRWLAYVSSESGRDEVYVRPFPNTSDGRWQISTDGGSQPRWAPDGRTIYYLDASAHVIAVSVTTGALFAVDKSKPLFDASGFALDPFHQAYDLTPDGRYFLFLAPRRLSDASRSPKLVRVDHWFNDLRARLAQ